MKGRAFLLVVFCLFTSLFASVMEATAQGSSPLVALTNSSGQLIVSSGDGSYRWIVTNPGETIVGDFAWSPNGSQLYFALGSGGDAALKAANVNQQSISDVGRIAGQPISISANANFLFFQQGNGSYGVQPLDGGAPVALPLSNDLDARNSGLWSDAAPLVAYWGFAGNSQLAVTNAANGTTITLDSGRSAPITPLAWRPGTTQLIYRDASGFVRLADVACLQNGCGGNPLADGAALLPAEATDIEADNARVYFRSGTALGAVDFGCVPANNCLNSAATLTANAAPQTALHIQNGTLVYTAYVQNANDPNDREVRTLDAACLSNPASCAPQPVIGGAVAGAVASNGRFTVVEQIGGGLSAVNLGSGAATYLADRGASLDQARWQ